MIKNENTAEEIEQWAKKHRAAVAIYDAPIDRDREQNRYVEERERSL